MDRSGGSGSLIGDAAFVVRPHAAAGTAKAAEDGWVLAEKLKQAQGARRPGADLRTARPRSLSGPSSGPAHVVAVRLCRLRGR